jgi:ribosomal protein L7/L12
MDDSSRVTELQAEVGALGRKFDYVMRHLGLTYSDDALAPALEQAAESLRQGNKLAAIQAYREATGAGLKESKEAIEALQLTLPGT